MADTGTARLPGIPTLRTDDRALAEWAKAVTEHLEVRNGARGNPAEKTVVQRDLESIQAALAELRTTKTAATEAATALPSADLAAPSVSSSTLNADVARVERTLNAALESLRGRIASAEGQIAASGTGSGEPLFRGIFGDLTGPYEVNGSKRWTLHPDAGLAAFGGTNGGRSGAYTTTVGDVLASLSHTLYRFEAWQGVTGSAPQLNGAMNVRLSASASDTVPLKDLATRVAYLSAPTKLRAFTHVEGSTTATTVGDVLDSLSHVNYSAASWAGSASEPKLNMQLKIRGTSGGVSGEYTLEELAKPLTAIPAATKLRAWTWREGETSTTMGDILDVLSHVLYSTVNWGGGGSGPVLNPLMRIGSAGGSTLQTLEDRVVRGTVAANLNRFSIINAGSGGSPYTLQNFTDDVAARLIQGAVPCSLNGDTAIGVAGMTLRSLHARVEQIGQEAMLYLQDHERRIGALEARP